MIFTIVAEIILTVLAIYLIFTFSSFFSLFLNLVILIAFYFLISRDLKEKANHKFYLFSLLLTAIFFISSTTPFIKSLLALAEKMLLSLPIAAVILVYLFANLMALVYKYAKELKEKYRK